MAMGRALALPLLIFNLILWAILLGLASWAYNRDANRGPIAGANNVTKDLALISLLAGVLGLASVFAGLHHALMPGSGSRGAAAATSLIASLVSLLMLGIASKHIHIGRNYGPRAGRKLKALEAFAIIPVFFQLLHTLFTMMTARDHDARVPTTATKGSSVV